MGLIEKAVARLDYLIRAGDESEARPAALDRPRGKPVPVREHARKGEDAAVDGGKPAPARNETPAFRAPREAEPAAGTPPLAGVATLQPLGAARASRRVVIDLKRLAAKGMVTPIQPRSQLAEEFRLVKRPLLRNVRATGPMAIAHGNLILVTSAMPGEGKSFTAINLAMSMAMELDYTVLLVDADVARPSVLSRLGLHREPGLMNVLGGEINDLSDVLLRTNIDNLTILPAGTPRSRATEMLASEAMSNLLAQIARRYSDRVVIFDSPPLLVTTESRVLAAQMGQVVIVVEAEVTTHGMVKQALATIESCPVKLMVLNKSRGEHSSGSYYGYGYGYGRSDKGRSKRKAKSRSAS
jgi:receptor protein-tyrosine kinase